MSSNSGKPKVNSMGKFITVPFTLTFLIEVRIMDQFFSTEFVYQSNCFLYKELVVEIKAVEKMG